MVKKRDCRIPAKAGIRQSPDETVDSCFYRYNRQLEKAAHGVKNRSAPSPTVKNLVILTLC
jgi:hypothetical protein